MKHAVGDVFPDCRGIGIAGVCPPFGLPCRAGCLVPPAGFALRCAQPISGSLHSALPMRC